jgi:hypothetical protein
VTSIGIIYDFIRREKTMYHTVSGGYYSPASVWRDPEDIKEEIDAIRLSLREANKRMRTLDAAKEGIYSLLDTEEIGEDTSVVSALELLLEKAEETFDECNLLSESLDDLKDELDESLWWARGGISKA